jgi:hypothetical protein
MKIVSPIKGGTYAKCVREHDAGTYLCIEEGRSNRRMDVAVY